MDASGSVPRTHEAGMALVHRDPEHLELRRPEIATEAGVEATAAVIVVALAVAVVATGGTGPLGGEGRDSSSGPKLFAGSWKRARGSGIPRAAPERLRVSGGEGPGSA